MDLFVKFGAFETAWVPVKDEKDVRKPQNELIFFGVDGSGRNACARVRGFPASCRFALDPDTTEESEHEAFDAWLRSGAFLRWSAKKLMEKIKRDVREMDVVTAVRKEEISPADRPVKTPWPAWRVDFCVVSLAACFAYDSNPFDGAQIPGLRGTPHVFSCSRTGNVLLQEFYRTHDVVPFTWWTLPRAVAVRDIQEKKTAANAPEFVLNYKEDTIRPTTSSKKRPSTSTVIFDIESLKDYAEHWESHFDVEVERRRTKVRKEMDEADKTNRGILNSWRDHKVCNVHVLYWRDWNAKSRCPDRSICFVLKRWDGGSFPSFESGEVGCLARDDLFEATTEVKHFDDEKELLSGFYGLLKALDPDVIGGWNILGYDLWMLEKRAIDALKMSPDILRIGRLTRRPCRCVDMSFQTAGKGSFGGKKELVVPGRVVIDGMYALQKDFSARVPLKNFSLNAAADYYAKDALGDFATKDDLPYENMRKAFASKSGRTFFCKYCLKDTYLTALVMQNMGLVSLYEAFCTSVGIEMHAVTFKGETERTLPNLRRMYESERPIRAMEVRVRV